MAYVKIDNNKKAILKHNDNRPSRLYVDGELMTDISYIDKTTEQDTYTSEYKANLIGLELQGNTVVVNDYTNEVMTTLINGSWATSGVSGVAIIGLPSELVDKNITYSLSQSLPSGYSIGLLKGDNWLFGDSVAFSTTPITVSGYDNIYITGILSFDEIPSVLEQTTIFVKEYGGASNIELKLKLPFSYQYQQVEYIESTGTQWIDTGLKPTDSMGVDVVFSSLNVTPAQYVFGARWSKSNNSVLFAIGASASNNVWAVYLTGEGQFFNIARSNNKKIEINVSPKTTQRVMTCTDLKSGYSSQLASTKSVADASLNAFIFAYNGGTINKSNGIKLYSCKMYDGTELTRDYIPCYRKSDNEIGLYDLANDVFYTNQGTGNFLKGDDVTSAVTTVAMTVNIPYTLHTGDKLTLKDKKVMLNDTDITSSEVGQKLLALAEATQNQTNTITATSEIPLSKKIITYAKWGGDSEN